MSTCYQDSTQEVILRLYTDCTDTSSAWNRDDVSDHRRHIQMIKKSDTTNVISKTKITVAKIVAKNTSGKVHENDHVHSDLFVCI